MVTAVLLILSVPASVLGATISLVVDPVLSTPLETAVGVYLHPEEVSANVIEGTIVIPRAIDSVSIRTGDSAVLLWPSPPQFVLADHAVTFVGGTPELFTPRVPSKLFTLYLKTALPGTYEFSTLNTTLYLADGKGTKLALADTPTSLYVSSSDGATTTPTDATRIDTSAPEIFAELGRNPDLFEGQAYVTFYGKDSGMGITLYQVKEGLRSDYRTVEQYYVLRDQSLRTPVWVRAIDGAGNETVIRVPGTKPSLLLPVMLIVFVLTVILGYYVVKRRVRTPHAPSAF